MTTAINSDVEKARTLLEAGDLVAIPTETVYGLAANAFSEEAVRKIFVMKNRPEFNPLIVHVGSIEQLDSVACNIPDLAYALARKFWPGPLTLLVEKKCIIPDIVTAGSTRVAVRMPDHPLTLKLLSLLPFPLAAPSANPFMCISPTQPEHVKTYFDGALQMILDGGNCISGIESTIIGFENGKGILYRKGSCDIDEIEKITGKLQFKKQETVTVEAPGMLKKHYAPKTPLLVTTNYKELLSQHSAKKVGVLTFTGKNECVGNTTYHSLSPDSSLKEAAANLYATLINLDSLNLDLILAEYVPDYGIGKAINDRLERASSS